MSHIADDVEEEEELQPEKKITRNINGHKREYHFLKTVNSMEELEKLRFKNYCRNMYGTQRQNLQMTFILPCSRKSLRRRCNFELRVERPNLESRKMHVYSHSRHNHPLMSEVRRAKYRREKELMPDANPPAIFRTADNIQWQFLQTVSVFERLQNVLLKHMCRSRSQSSTEWCRIRFPCHRRRYNCQFTLVAMKTTRDRYHVYKHGNHNHPIRTSKDEQMESDEEDGEEEDDDSEEVEEDEEEEEEGDSSEEDVTIVEYHQEAEQREGPMEFEIVGENSSANAHQPRRLGPKEIHEFHNVGAWLRRKR